MGFWIACLLALVLVVVAIALVVTVLWDRLRPTAPAQPRTDRSEALGVLERRYAAGDIDEDEFRRRRTLLDH